MAPNHVVILGLGPSLEAYVDKVKRMGSRKSFADEVWGINAVGDVVQCDKIFHMDDVRVQEARAAEKPSSNIANMLTWMRQHPGPIYTSLANPAYPGLVEFPLEAVLNEFGLHYFNGTGAYAVAYAIFIGVKRISLFGCDFTYQNSHHAERGRACMEFWLGIAWARGIEITISDQSSLMDACEPADQIYGYDCVNVLIEKAEDGLAKVSFTPKATPAPEEVEDRYDHTKPPNPILRRIASAQS